MGRRSSVLESAVAPGDRLLIISAECHGHSLSYTHAILNWALSRGLGAVCLGPVVPDSQFARRYAAEPMVRFQNVQDEPSSEDAPPYSFKWICQVQKRLNPHVCMLLNTDALLFESMELLEPGARFPVPTFGIATFGHRERYTGFDEPYAARLSLLLGQQGPGVGPFAGLFTLDEYHARHTGGRVRFLPDIYCDLPALPQSLLASRDRDEARRLATFLDGCGGSVLPLLGKFDRRKNPLWVLRLAAKHPGLACVVLGQRVSAPEDMEIDALLDELQRAGRAFVCFRYVPEALFDVVLRHPRTRILPLPYQCHFGSSGLQLLAHHRGKPVLTADQGLMARRTREWGLGCTFRVGSEADFCKAYEALAAEDSDSFARNCKRFMRYFSKANLFAALEVLLVPKTRGALLPAIRSQEEGSGYGALQDGLTLALEGRLEEALNRFDKALQLEPQAADRHLRRLGVLLRMGRLAEAQSAVELAVKQGLAEEFRFLVRLSLDYITFLRLRGNSEASPLLLSGLAISKDDAAVRAPPLKTSLCDIPQPKGWRKLCQYLEVSLSSWEWRLLGDAMVWDKQCDLAAICYAKALNLSPEDPSLALSLSDVLRYQGRYPESLAVLDRLAKAAPDPPGLWHKRGQVLLAQGLAAEALTAFAREPADSPYAAAVGEHVILAQQALPLA